MRKGKLYLSLNGFSVQIQRQGFTMIFIDLDVYMLSVLLACEGDIDVHRGRESK
jgi:hypothetical protein